MSTVRISKRSHAILKRLSNRLGVSMIEALDMVTDRWEREEFLASVNSAYEPDDARPQNSVARSH